MATNTKDSERAAELKTARVLLAQKGWKVADLARETRFSRHRLSSLLCGDDPSWPIRAGVNKALGYDVFIKPTRRQPGSRRPAARKNSSVQL